jgi:hypothetical protein
VYCGEPFQHVDPHTGAGAGCPCDEPGWIPRAERSRQ